MLTGNCFEQVLTFRHYYLTPYQQRYSEIVFLETKKTSVQSVTEVFNIEQLE